MKHLLVVDDDPFTCKMVSLALSKKFKVTTAESGQAALEILEKTSFNLIILDIVMPGMDGWEVIGHIRAKHQSTLTPVMFLTGMTREEDRVRGFRLGADDFLSKPFVAEELRQRVDRALRRAENIGKPDLESDETGLKGSLSDFGLASLLTILAMENKTGYLHLLSQKHHLVLHLRNGQLVCARNKIDIAKTSYDNIHLALAFKKGDFYFVSGEVNDPDEFQQTTSQLLLDVARVMDEQKSGETWQDDPML